jgi:hypothetical protein
MMALAARSAMVALAAPVAPPPAAAALLSALESGDARAARATLAQEVTIMDSSSGSDVSSTLEAVAGYARGCRRSDLSVQYDSEDPRRGAVTVTWTCPAHSPGQAFVWTEGTQVVWIQFGMPLPRAR